jgi:hypothetical protein
MLPKFIAARTRRSSVSAIWTILATLHKNKLAFCETSVNNYFLGFEVIIYECVTKWKYPTSKRPPQMPQLPCVGNDEHITVPCRSLARVPVPVQTGGGTFFAFLCIYQSQPPSTDNNRRSAPMSILFILSSASLLIVNS